MSMGAEDSGRDNGRKLLQPWEGTRRRKSTWTTGSCFPLYESWLQSKVINKTGKTIALQSKYRDIWEGKRYELKGGDCAIVRWKPAVYKRLGVFVESKDGQSRASVMYFNNYDLKANEEIAITYLPS